jgi:hypothetical protein
VALVDSAAGAVFLDDPPLDSRAIAEETAVPAPASGVATAAAFRTDELEADGLGAVERGLASGPAIGPGISPG